MTEYGDRFAKAIAEELRAQKARTKKTNDEISEEVGVSAVTVLRYLRGQRQIPIDVFGDLCKALDVNAADITAIAFTKAQSVYIHPSELSEDEKADLAMRDLGQSDFGIAALRDGNKKKESEHFADEGA